MRGKILPASLALLMLTNLIQAIVMEDFMSLIAAIGFGFLAELAWSRREPQAPTAEEESFGSLNHQVLYLRALKHCRHRINYDRANGAHLSPTRSYWHQKYVHDKWTYARVVHRYKEAQKRYGWEDL